MLIGWLLLLTVTTNADPFAAPFSASAPLTMTTTATALPCAGCHAEIAREQAGSRHARSADNALFTAGFARERHPRCAYCHAPVDDAAVRLLRATTTTMTKKKATTAHVGVDCIACHVRDGRVWSARAARGYGHTVDVSPALADGTLCARCHEFSAHEVVDGVTRLLPDVPMQSTASEHRAFVAAGGVGTCTSCHMPVVDGHASHAFVAGAHDVEALKQALVVDVAADGRSVTLSSRGVGHHYPTGDVFRRLVVSVDDVAVMTIGVRRAVDDDDDDDDDDHWQPALVPGERRVIALPRGRALTISYHRADDAEEARGAVSFDELVSVLVTRPLPHRGRR